MNIASGSNIICNIRASLIEYTYVAYLLYCARTLDCVRLIAKMNIIVINDYIESAHMEFKNRIGIMVYCAHKAFYWGKSRTVLLDKT